MRQGRRRDGNCGNRTCVLRGSSDLQKRLKEVREDVDEELERESKGEEGLKDREDGLGRGVVLSSVCNQLSLEYVAEEAEEYEDSHDPLHRRAMVNLGETILCSFQETGTRKLHHD